MFTKILIANSGEIACHIAHSANNGSQDRCGGYSEADAEALHVRMMDEAVPIGPSAARDSYLNIANIAKAVERTRTDALHPGYGYFFGERGVAGRACGSGHDVHLPAGSDHYHDGR